MRLSNCFWTAIAHALIWHQRTLSLFWLAFKGEKRYNSPFKRRFTSSRGVIVVEKMAKHPKIKKLTQGRAVKIKTESTEYEITEVPLVPNCTKEIQSCKQNGLEPRQGV